MQLLTDRLRALGPFFTLHVGDLRREPGWIPVPVLLDDSAPAGERLRALVEEMARRLGTTEHWVAGSILFQSWAAHLTSVHVGSVALGGPVPDLAARHLHVRTGPTGGLELGADPVIVTDVETGWRRLTTAHLDPLAVAVRRQVRIGRRVLAGNVASAMAGSLESLARAGLAPLDRLVEEPWAQPPPTPAYGTWMRGAGEPRYARTTCCGYQRLPGAGRCGDCSLTWRGRRGLAPPTRP